MVKTISIWYLPYSPRFKPWAIVGNADQNRFNGLLFHIKLIFQLLILKLIHDQYYYGLK